MIGVYFIQCNANGFWYIGASERIEKRWTIHRSELNTGSHKNKFLRRDGVLYGKNNFYFGILEQCRKDKLPELEKYYIDIFKPEYNILLDGRTWAGMNHYPSTIKKMKKPKPPGFGEKLRKPRSEYFKRHLSEVLSGRPSPLKGRKMGKETREKHRENNLGEKSHFYGSGNAVLQLDFNDNVIGEYISAFEASLKVLGHPRGRANIIAVCKKRRPRMYGYKWTYKKQAS